MYKVFSNGRIIFFQNSFKESFCKHSGLFYQFENDTEFELVLELFETVYALKKLFVIHPNPEEAFNAFQKLTKADALVGAVIVNEHNELLMIKRWNKWDLPKGNLQEGVDPFKGILNEMKAECGLVKLKIEEMLQPGYYFYTLNNERVLKKIIWFRMSHSGSSSNLNGKEEYTWVKKEQLSEFLENSFEQISDVLQDSGLV